MIRRSDSRSIRLSDALEGPIGDFGLSRNVEVMGPDRHTKENIQPVDPRAVLDKVAGMPVSEWSYKNDASSRHVSPMAQDFRAAFGLGHDDKGIAIIDADGVALAAIQEWSESHWN